MSDFKACFAWVGWAAAVVGLAAAGGCAGHQEAQGEGVATGSHTVIFVCDGSAAMADTWGDLTRELDHAILGLRNPQKLSAIILHDGTYSALAEEPLLATDENKERAREFIHHFAPEGAAVAGPAMAAAIGSKPDIIFLVGGGDFADGGTLADAIHKLNEAPQVKISTVAFLNPATPYRQVLEQIAKENGGLARYVTRADLADWETGRAGGSATPATSQP